MPPFHPHLSRIIDPNLRADQQVLVDGVLDFPKFEPACSDETFSRADVAFALHAVLFARLLDHVPEGLAYIQYKLMHHDRVTLDHGALRTVAGYGPSGSDAGRLQIARFLEPLGYYQAEIYPLERLRMTGYAFRHRDYPEEIPQYFVSELHPDQFSNNFQKIVARLMSTITDPLSSVHKGLLNKLKQDHKLCRADAVKLVEGLVNAFGRNHDMPTWDEYIALRAESAEMAWISTEGQTFNHATTRSSDLHREVDLVKNMGFALKKDIEVSTSGRVLQTALRAADVLRHFPIQLNDTHQQKVPGSFFEFIERKPLPTTGTDAAPLDLSFDSSNAQGIFAMTNGSL